MKKNPFPVPFVLSVLLLFFGCGDNGSLAQAPATEKPAANIILFIGDGAGVEAIGLAKDYVRTVDGRTLWLEKIMARGNLALVDAPSIDTLVTDSAAAATAIATGERTDNECVAMTPEGIHLTTILELAMKDDRSTGLVTTTRLTHATPACFAAHVKSRKDENGIAEQLVASGADVMMGGGLAYWTPQGSDISDFSGFADKSARKDSLNLLETARAKGYQVVTNREQLRSATRTEKLLGLFASSHLPYAIDRHFEEYRGVPSLSEMTEKAIDILSRNKNGFFLMVEGGRIDHAAHSNDIASLLHEMADFDEAIGVAFAFAGENPSTAIFITADHATGAPSLSARYSEETDEEIYPSSDVFKKISRQDASFEHLVYAVANEPSMETVKRLVFNHTGIEISEEDAAFVLKMQPVSPFHVVHPKYRELGYPVLALANILGAHYETAWATAGHYHSPVILVGYGPRADLVKGYIGNDDIFRIMRTVGEL